MSPIAFIERHALGVLLVDHQRLFRDALAAALELQGYRIAGSMDHGEARSLASQDRISGPVVLLLEMDPPESGGLELCRWLRRRIPDARILALSHRLDGPAMLEAIVAGVQGYVLKDAPLDRLLTAVEALEEGRTLLAVGASRIARRALRWSQLAQQTVAVRSPALTPREKQIALLVAEGSTNREIAAALLLSPHTVRHYVENVMDKLGAHTRAQIASRTVQGGAVGMAHPVLVPGDRISRPA